MKNFPITYAMISNRFLYDGRTWNILRDTNTTDYFLHLCQHHPDF